MQMKRTSIYGKRFGDTVKIVTTNSTIERDELRKHGWHAVPKSQLPTVIGQIKREGVEVAEPVTYREFFGKSL